MIPSLSGQLTLKKSILCYQVNQILAMPSRSHLTRIELEHRLYAAVLFRTYHICVSIREMYPSKNNIRMVYVEELNAPLPVQQHQTARRIAFQL